MMNGIIVIDKPKGFTSFDVVSVMRKLCNTKKIGHTGTLDPMATGVLPVLIGTATKAQALLPNTDKEYLASFKLGIKTDTQDITGKILKTSEYNVLKEDLEKALEDFNGNILQIPPMYSALKHNGKRLYDLAREGIEVERKARPINIKKIELSNFDEGTKQGNIKISCSQGTYIRTICDDLGEKLGTYAVMTDLRRTVACGFNLSECISIEKARNLNDELKNYIVPTWTLFKEYKKITITSPQTTRFKNGGALDISRINVNDQFVDDEYFRVYDPEDIFLGLGKVSCIKKELKVIKHF